MELTHAMSTVMCEDFHQQQGLVRRVLLTKITVALIKDC